MPIYEYKCDECGKISEFFESSSGRAKRSCPQCGSPKLTKELSVFSAGVRQGDSKRCNGCTDVTCPHTGR